jgi:hypothetical protein
MSTVFTVLEDIRDERRRQVEDEGFTHLHDDEHDHEQLLHAAQAYFYAAVLPHAMPGGYILALDDTDYLRQVPRIWPWQPGWWKFGTTRRMLVKAGALCLAESDRWARRGDGESAIRSQQLLCKVVFYILKVDGTVY